MRRSQPTPVGEILASYTAEELPNDAIERIQHEVLTEYRQGEVPVADVLRVLNLLLIISLQKLRALA
jgi:hypothetical protein